MQAAKPDRPLSVWSMRRAIKDLITTKAARMSCYDFDFNM
jgi:hypothetical protein